MESVKNKENSSVLLKINNELYKNGTAFYGSIIWRHTMFVSASKHLFVL